MLHTQYVFVYEDTCILVINFAPPKVKSWLRHCLWPAFSGWTSVNQVGSEPNQDTKYSKIFKKRKKGKDIYIYIYI